MNIAIFASAFYPHFGGVEELVRQLALELRRQGHSAIILTNRWPRDLPRREAFEGIPVYRIPFRAPDAGLKSKVTFGLSRSSIEREVVQILTSHDIDVIHVQCVSSNGYYALRSSQAMNIPLIVTLQGELTMDATGLFARSAFARQTLAGCMNSASLVTACSRKTLQDAEQFCGQSLGSRGRAIFNGANLFEFRSAQPYHHKRPYLFAIGRLVPQKGFDLLLRAFALSGVGSHDLLLAGDGPELQPLRSLSSELNLNDSVHFLGRADRAAVPGLFAGCDFFVLPSRADEGLPVVTAEAMAAGKAVIATRSGGTPEAVLDAKTGMIVEKEDVPALAASIQNLCANPQLRDRMANAGRQHAQAFAWPTITAQYLDAYNAARGSSQYGNRPEPRAQSAQPPRRPVQTHPS